MARPRTFNEKVIRKRLVDRRPYLAATADKYEVREYVRRRIGEEHLAALLQVTDTADDVDVAALPRSFVVKPTHGSGAVELVRDKETHDLEAMRAHAASWLRRRWALWYRAIPPRIMVEEFLGDPEAGPPEDVKLFVMNGEVQMVQVDTDRATDHRRSLYSPDWTLLPGRFEKRPSAANVARPQNLDTMLELARRLADETDFARVDFYDLGDRVVFGELTHSPGAGRSVLQPESFDAWLGSRWTQPGRYR